MTDRDKLDKKASFLKMVSKNLDIISEPMAQPYSYYMTEGQWPFDTDIEAKEYLGELLECIAIEMEIINSEREAYAHKLLKRALNVLQLLSSLIRTGQKFMGIARGENDNDREIAYLYDIYSELFPQHLHVKLIATQLRKVVEMVQCDSNSPTRKERKVKDDTKLSCLSLLSMELQTLAHEIVNFELPEGNRKDYFALARLINLEYQLNETCIVFDYARGVTSHSLFEEAEILLGVIRQNLQALYNIEEFMPPNAGADWIVDLVKKDFAIADRRISEIENLGFQFSMAHYAALNGSDITGSTKKQSWRDDTPDYMFLSDAIVTLADNKPTLPTLSKKIKPDGPIRYMRKGQRCKVHIGDFREYAKNHYLSDALAGEITDEYMAEVEARKKQEKIRRRKKCIK